MNLAVYASATSFIVPKDRTGTYKKGLQLIAIQGSGNVQVSVVSSSYNSVANTTTIVIEDGTLTASLSRVLLGPTYSDPANSDSNTGKHLHTGPKDGGLIPAASISAAQTTSLKTIPVPSTGDEHKLVKVNPTASLGYQLASLAGVTNRTTVTLGDGTIVVSTPQDIHTGANPTFAGITFSGLTGILEGKGATAVGVVTGDTALMVLRRKGDNSGYEFALINFGDLGDADFDSVADGDLLLRSSGKWINLPKGPEKSILKVKAGVPQWWASTTTVAPTTTTAAPITTTTQTPTTTTSA